LGEILLLPRFTYGSSNCIESEFFLIFVSLNCANLA
jgi:hypothetical protein